MEADWPTALSNAMVALSSAKNPAVVAGAQADAEALVAAKDFLASNFDANTFVTEQRFPQTHGGNDFRSNYIFNTSIADIEDADLVLIVRAHHSLCHGDGCRQHHVSPFARALSLSLSLFRLAQTPVLRLHW